MEGEKVSQTHVNSSLCNLLNSRCKGWKHSSQGFCLFVFGGGDGVWNPRRSLSDHLRAYMPNLPGLFKLSLQRKGLVFYAEHNTFHANIIMDFIIARSSNLSLYSNPTCFLHCLALKALLDSFYWSFTLSSSCIANWCSWESSSSSVFTAQSGLCWRLLCSLGQPWTVSLALSALWELGLLSLLTIADTL